MGASGCPIRILKFLAVLAQVKAKRFIFGKYAEWSDAIRHPKKSPCRGENTHADEYNGGNFFGKQFGVSVPKSFGSEDSGHQHAHHAAHSVAWKHV